MPLQARLLVAMLLFSAPAQAEVFIVSNGNDSGPGSLRQAILDANAAPGFDSIALLYDDLAFMPTSPLPQITGPIRVQQGLTIDGSRAGAGDGLVFTSGGNEVLSVHIGNFSGYGIVFQGGSDNVIRSGTVRKNGKGGILATGTTSLRVGPTPERPDSRLLAIFGNHGPGLVLVNATGSVIDGIAVGTEDLFETVDIIGNGGHGIVVNGGSENTITGSWIAGSGGDGISIEGGSANTIAGNHISGSGSGGIAINGGAKNAIIGNRISGSGGDGLRVTGSRENTIDDQVVVASRVDGIALIGSTDNILGAQRSNSIGDNGRHGIAVSSGADRNHLRLATATRNRGAGIHIQDSAGNIIGFVGNPLDDRSVAVFGNDVGIVLSGGVATGNVIRSADIGRRDDFTGPAGNARYGILVTNGASGNIIGTAELTNHIQFNGAAGIMVESGRGNRVTNIDFVQNAGPPIDLGGDGRTPNDAWDADFGSNELQNFPFLVTAYRGHGTVAEGVLDARPNTIYTIHFYDLFNVLLPAEGQIALFRDTTTVTTDAAGRAIFRLEVAVSGEFLSATATDAAGNTSEMSAPVRIRTVGTFEFDAASFRVKESAGTVTVGIRRTGPVDWTAGVDYRTADGTAVAGSDYTAASGTIVFQPGESLKTFTVPIIKDPAAEGIESFRLELLNPTNQMRFVFGAPPIATVVIDDQEPTYVNADDVNLEEGDRTSAVTFRVTVTAAEGHPVSVGYRTVAGTATAGEDFTAVSGRVTVPAGQTHAIVTVPLLGDVAVEGDETFHLELSDPSGAVLGRSEGTATLRNDDGVPVIATAAVHVEEAFARITLRRTALNGEPTHLNYRVVHGTAGPRDVRAAEGTVSFDAEATEQRIDIHIENDSIAEADETFVVELFEPENAIVVQDRITVTIPEDPADTRIKAEARDFSVEESDSGSRAVAFTVRLSRPSDVPLTFSYSLEGNSATKGIDFEGGDGSLTFSPGETDKSIPFTIFGDTVAETTERIALRLDQSYYEALLINDDGPSISVADATVVQTEGPTARLIEVTLDAPSTEVIGFEYDIHLGTARVHDLYGFGAPTSVVLFDPGTTTTTIEVHTANSYLRPQNPDRRFTIVLRNPSYGRIADGEAVITIDDEMRRYPKAVLTVRDISIEEPVGGVARASFTLERAASNDGWSAVDVETTPGTAGETDFARTVQRVVFGPGVRTKTVEVDVVADGLAEGPEWFFLLLRNPAGVELGRDIAVGTIYDPGQQPQRRRTVRH